MFSKVHDWKFGSVPDVSGLHDLRNGTNLKSDDDSGEPVVVLYLRLQYRTCCKGLIIFPSQRRQRQHMEARARYAFTGMWGGADGIPDVTYLYAFQV